MEKKEQEKSHPNNALSNNNSMCVISKVKLSSEEHANLPIMVVYFVCNNFYFDRHCVIKIFFLLELMNHLFTK